MRTRYVLCLQGGGLLRRRSAVVELRARIGGLYIARIRSDGRRSAVLLLRCGLKPGGTDGLSWQIVPIALDEMMQHGSSEQRARVTQAFLKMKNSTSQNCNEPTKAVDVTTDITTIVRRG